MIFDQVQPMQIQRLKELIQHPERVVAADRDGLKAWSEKYPFAGSISMLLARASAVGGHMEQEVDLLKAATHGTYRQPLYDLLLTQQLKAEAEAVEVLVEGMPEIEPDSPTKVGEEPAGHLDPDIPLEREALIEAIGRTIEQEVGPEAMPAKPDAAQRQSDLRLIQSAAASPFAQWLNQRAAEVGFGAGGVALQGGIPTDRMGKQDSQALIDRFIENQPRIGKLREVDASVEEWAKESVMEDPTLVTETMARIFAKQGQIGKARKAYRHLALKYPAKSTYFAAQLKKLSQTQKGETGANE